MWQAVCGFWGEVEMLAKGTKAVGGSSARVGRNPEVRGVRRRGRRAGKESACGSGDGVVCAWACEYEHATLVARARDARILLNPSKPQTLN